MLPSAGIAGGAGQLWLTSMIIMIDQGSFVGWAS